MEKYASDIMASAEVPQGSNEKRAHQKGCEADLKMAASAGIPMADGCKYHDYRIGDAPPQQEARNDAGSPPAPAVGASSVFHGEGTN